MSSEPSTVTAPEVPETEQQQEQQSQQQGEKTKQPKQPKQQKPKPQAQQQESKKGDDLGITVKKSEDFPAWYTQICLKAELIEYHDISGCYVLRPWVFYIWEQIQGFIDAEIKKLGVKNCYFPMFLNKRHLEVEKEHLEGFAPEVAWVTQSGDTKLDEPIAIRPTSETIMYPYFAKWIRSHRDLPLKLNQWCNVVRWEFKYPTPFIRSREFLWQEGHTAHATREEAEKEVYQILDIYARTYEELLGVSMVKGRKTELEKFAGGLFTTTIEGYIPVVGRGIQAATSHCLGNNFAEMFHIEYLADDAKKHLAWQNSWGFTTRSIGVMIMTHSDDKGLVLPPRVAPIQVVIVPIFMKEREALQAKSVELYNALRDAGIRVELDDRDNYRPGWKFAHWEVKGVPLRIEFGMRDMEANTCVISRRDTGEKTTVSLDAFVSTVQQMLDTVQRDLYTRARDMHMSNICRAVTWEEFMGVINRRRLAIIPWCQESSCEEEMKKRSAIDSKLAAQAIDENQNQEQEGGEKLERLTGAAKSLCIPFEQPKESLEGHKCIGCGKDPKTWVLFGRSY